MAARTTTADTRHPYPHGQQRQLPRETVDSIATKTFTKAANDEGAV